MANVPQLIFEKFDQVLATRAEGFSAPSFKKIVVGMPKFLSKERQRIKWSNKVRVVMELRPIDSLAAVLAPEAPIEKPRLTSFGQVRSEAHVDLTDNLSQYLNMLATKLALMSNIRIANHAFEVVWDCAHQTDGSLADPQLIDSKHIDTTWQDR